LRTIKRHKYIILPFEAAEFGCLTDGELGPRSTKRLWRRGGLGMVFFSGVKVKNDLHNRNYSLKHVVIHVHDSLLASESTLLESA